MVYLPSAGPGPCNMSSLHLAFPSGRAATSEVELMQPSMLSKCGFKPSSSDHQAGSNHQDVLPAGRCIPSSHIHRYLSTSIQLCWSHSIGDTCIANLCHRQQRMFSVQHYVVYIHKHHNGLVHSTSTASLAAERISHSSSAHIICCGESWGFFRLLLQQALVP